MATLTVKELFDFAVDPAVTDDNLDDTLDALMQLATRCGRLLLLLGRRVCVIGAVKGPGGQWDSC